MSQKVTRIGVNKVLHKFERLYENQAAPLAKVVKHIV